MAVKGIFGKPTVQFGDAIVAQKLHTPTFCVLALRMINSFVSNVDVQSPNLHPETKLALV